MQYAGEQAYNQGKSLIGVISPYKLLRFALLTS